MCGTTQPKRVFILGAGFSKGAGMPLGDELIPDLIAHSCLADNQEFHSWQQSLEARVQHLRRSLDRSVQAKINVEEFFNHAHFDCEQWMMCQHECPVGRHAGDTPWSNAEAIRNWLKELERGLVRVILDRQRRPDLTLDRLKGFAAALRYDDRVLTFNYDTLLETAIEETGNCCFHGFRSENQSAITVLKLHGSIDWWLLDRGCTLRGAEVLFDKLDANPKSANVEKQDWEYRVVLHRVRRLDDVYQLAEDAKYPSEYVLRSGIAGLGTYKPLHRLVGSGYVWRKARAALRNAHEIYIIGWSASAFDSMARLYFADEVHARGAPPRRIVIIDPNVGEQYGNYATIFGEKIETIATEAQHVDWSKCLMS